MRTLREKHDLFPLAIHVNLTSVDPVIRPKSIAAFRGEPERAEAIGAEYLVWRMNAEEDSCLELTSMAPQIHQMRRRNWYRPCV